MTHDRLISLNAAIDAVHRNYDTILDFRSDGETVANSVEDILSELSSVDAVLVVHGRWIDETFKAWGLVHHPYKCDQCGYHSEAPSDYCPDCGARMDGKGDGNG